MDQGHRKVGGAARVDVKSPFIRLVWLAAVIVGLHAPLAHAEVCPKLSPSALSGLVKERGPLKLIFFASWCGECLHHMRATQTKNTLLIATFDEKDAVEQVIQKLRPNAPCYLDDGVAAKLGVNGVPRVVQYDGSASKS